MKEICPECKRPIEGTAKLRRDSYTKAIVSVHPTCAKRRPDRWWTL
jgi:hypothetical protein